MPAIGLMPMLFKHFTSNSDKMGFAIYAAVLPPQSSHYMSLVVGLTGSDTSRPSSCAAKSRLCLLKRCPRHEPSGRRVCHRPVSCLPGLNDSTLLTLLANYSGPPRLLEPLSFKVILCQRTILEKPEGDWVVLGLVVGGCVLKHDPWSRFE